MFLQDAMQCVCICSTCFLFLWCFVANVFFSPPDFGKNSFQSLTSSKNQRFVSKFSQQQKFQVTAVFCQTAIDSAQNDHAMMAQSILENKDRTLLSFLIPPLVGVTKPKCEMWCCQEAHHEKIKTLFSKFSTQEQAWTLWTLDTDKSMCKNVVFFCWPSTIF